MVEWILEHAWSLLGAGLLLICIGGFFVESKRERFALPILIPAALLFYAGFIALIWRGGTYLYRLYQASDLGLAPVATIAGIVLALALYNLRLRQRALYGVIEVVIGTISILFSTEHATEAATAFITAVGGIYVIVRGLDNIDLGLPANRRSLWDRYLKFEGVPAVRNPAE